MKNTEFQVAIDELHKKLTHLTDTKGAEYTLGRDNRFDNFERQGKALGLIPEQVLMVFLSKHLDSITTYVKDQSRGFDRAYSEPMTGRVDDAILYLLLLRCMIERKACDKGDTHWLPGREMRVGGVTTAERVVVIEGGGPNVEVQVEPKSRRVVLCSQHSKAVEVCKVLGLPPSVAALSAVDQLYGLKTGDTVTYLHSDSPKDAAMLREVHDRAATAGFTIDLVML